MWRSSFHQGLAAPAGLSGWRRGWGGGGAGVGGATDGRRVGACRGRVRSSGSGQGMPQMRGGAVGGWPGFWPEASRAPGLQRSPGDARVYFRGNFFLTIILFPDTTVQLSRV